MMVKKIFLFACVFGTLLLLIACQEVPSSTGRSDMYACHLANCTGVFIDALGGAKNAQCAFYDLSDQELIESLEQAQAQLVVDDHVQGIAFASRRVGEGIMHHKFCVINTTLVVTGSFNPTGSVDDYNNVLRIESPAIAEAFEDIFDQLMRRSKHSSHHNRFMHNGALIEVYACPQDDCKGALLRTIDAANHSVRFALFTFTDPEVAQLLVRKHEQGVDVSGVVESFQSRALAQYPYLQEQGIAVLLEQSSRLQHNKLFVIDNATVVTGSYNPTLAAASINDEALIIIHDEGLAQAYALLLLDIEHRTQTFK